VKVLIDGEEKKLPDFLIVGAAKSGTTAVYNYLKNHPRIFLPENKEPWFFSFMGEEIHFLKPNSDGTLVSQGEEGPIYKLADYISLFNKSSESQIIGEASTSYLYTSDKTIINMKKIYGEKYKNVKIIIILRNPIDRAWSNYLMHVRDGTATGNFSKSINIEKINNLLKQGVNIGYDYIGFGMYYEQVRKFLNSFPNIKIVLYDDLCKDPQVVLKEIQVFLGVPITTINVNKKYNVSGVPVNRLAEIVGNIIYKPNKFKSIFKNFLPLRLREKIRMSMGQYLYKKRQISSEDKVKIYEIYQEDINKLENLIHMNLNKWKIN